MQIAFATACAACYNRTNYTAGEGGGDMQTKGAGKRLAIRLCIVVVGVVLAVLLYRPALLIFGPFLLAYFFARAMEPAVRRIGGSRPGVRRVASYTLVILTFLAAIAVLVWLAWELVTELRQLTADWAMILDAARETAQRVAARLFRGDGALRGRALQIVDALTQSLAGVMEELRPRLLGWLSGLARYAPQALMFLLVLAMSACILSQDFPDRSARLAARLGAEKNRTISHVLRVIRAAFGGYLLRGVLRAAGVMVTCLAAFAILDVQYRAVLAIALGVLDFLPCVGGGTVLLPWCVYSFVQGHWVTGLWLLATYAAILLERLLIRRRDESAPRLGAFAELCCVFVGWKLWSFWGILLGPLFARIVVNLHRAGVFDSTQRDCKLLYQQILEKFKRPQEPKNSGDAP